MRRTVEAADVVLRQVRGVRQRLAAGARSALLELERGLPPLDRRGQWEHETALLKQAMEVLLAPAQELPPSSKAEAELRTLAAELELVK